MNLALDCIGSDRVDLSASNTAGDTPPVVLDSETGRRVDAVACDLFPDETPVLVREMDALLKAAALVGSAVDKARIGYAILRAEFDVSESDIRRGQLELECPMRVSFIGNAPNHIGIDTALAGTKPYALSAALVGYDTRALPFDVQVALTGVSDADSLRDCILLGRDLAERGSKTCKPHALLTRPLVCHEPLTGSSFGSIEAIGFDAQQLRSNVLEHVTAADQPERAQRFAQLFGQRQAALANLGVLLDATLSCAGGGGGSGASQLLRSFYLVPTVYEFTKLLVRVHLFLTMRAVRIARISSPAIDMSLYEVPYSRGHMVFPAAELDEVIDFINTHLVGAHPSFLAGSLSARISPFNYASWSDAWSNVVAPHDPAVPLDERRLSCAAEFVIFYVSFARGTVAGDAQLLQKQSASLKARAVGALPAHKPSLSSFAYYGQLTDDEDDDDDDSVVFGAEAVERSVSSAGTDFSPMPQPPSNMPFPLDICTPRAQEPESPDTFRLSGIMKGSPSIYAVARKRLYEKKPASSDDSATLSSSDSAAAHDTPPPTMPRSAVIPIHREETCAREAYSADTVPDSFEPQTMELATTVFQLDEQAV